MKKIKSLNSKLSEYVKQIRSNEARFLPFLSTTLYAIRESFSDSELGYLKDFFREALSKMPQGSELLAIYDQAPPDFIFTKIYPIVGNDQVGLAVKRRLIDSYTSLLSLEVDQKKSLLSEQQARELLEAVKNHEQCFRSHLSQIRTYIEERFFEYPFIEIFRNPPYQEKFVSSQTISNFIETLSTDSLGDGSFEKKLGLLLDLEINDKLEPVLNKLVEFVQFETTQPLNGQRVKLCQTILSLLERLRDPIKQSTDRTKIQEISSRVIDCYSKDQEPNHRNIYIKLIEQLKSIEGNPLISNLDAQIRDFISKAKLETFNQFGKIWTAEKASEYPDEFIISSVQDLKILKLGFGGIPTQKYPGLVDNLLNYSDRLDIENKKKYFDLVDKLKCANDLSLKAQFFTKLMNVKPTNPEIVKKYMNKTYFSEEQRNSLKENI